MMSIFFCVALDIIIYLAPVKSPFPGERGQGDRDSKLEVCFKNRFFLQAVAVELSTAFFLFSDRQNTSVSCITFKEKKLRGNDL